MAIRPSGLVPPALLFNFSGTRVNLGALPNGVAGGGPVVVGAADPGMGHNNLRARHRVASAQQAQERAKEERLHGFNF